MPPIIGNPQDVLTTPYGYSGQMSPETAIAEQALNRRRLLANLLTQQGMQQPKGQMVGRFYVAANPLEHVAGLANVAAGAYANHAIDSSQKDLIAKDQQSVIDAIRQFQAKRNQPQQFQSPQEESGMPPAPAAPASPSTSHGATAGPYIGQVGANAVPEATVQTDKPPMMPTPLGGNNSDDLRIGDPQKDNVIPGDMSAFAPAPQSAGPPVRMVEPPGPRKTTIDDLAELLTHQHPQVRQYGAMMAQQLQRQQEMDTAERRHAEDVGLRREGLNIQSDQTKALREMQQQQFTMNYEAKQRELDQQHEFNKQRMQDTRLDHDQRNALQAANLDIERQKMGLEKMRVAEAVRHNKADEGLQAQKKQARGTLPTSALKMQNEELDAISTAASIQSDMASLRSQIDSGKLKLGLLSNLAGEARNKLGMSDESSRNLASFKASLEKMRNDSLRLNKGVQTEGDAVRAWNELMSSTNDPALVKQRLAEIEAMNERAVNIRKMNVDTIRQNFGADPMDTGGYETQPATVGAQKGSVIGNGPKAGTIEDGYRFKGGNPADPNSWEKVN